MKLVSSEGIDISPGVGVFNIISTSMKTDSPLYGCILKLAYFLCLEDCIAISITVSEEFLIVKKRVNVQLRDILGLAGKWLWLIILACLIGGGAGLVVDHYQPKKY